MENRAYALAAAGLFTLLLGFGVVADRVVVQRRCGGNDAITSGFARPVSGLNTQAPVRYRGVTVGKVTDIKFDPDNNRADTGRILCRRRRL